MHQPRPQSAPPPRFGYPAVVSAPPPRRRNTSAIIAAIVIALALIAGTIVIVQATRSRDTAADPTSQSSLDETPAGDPTDDPDSPSTRSTASPSEAAASRSQAAASRSSAAAAESRSAASRSAQQAAQSRAAASRSAQAAAQSRAAASRAHASRVAQSKAAASRAAASQANAAQPAAGTPVYELARHPMLADPRAGLPNTACFLPPWNSDRAATERFFRLALKCLDGAWAPVLKYYRLPFSSPRLVFPTGDTIRSECGEYPIGVRVAAFYCEGTMYIPHAGLQTDLYGNDPGVYLALFAHEYGHHVQELAGLMDAAWVEIRRHGEDTAAGQEMSRRKELQAQCFSGMWLGSTTGRGGTIDRDMFDNANRDQQTRGDDNTGVRDHGSNANYAKWWRTGAEFNRLSRCNTFSAATSAVG